jgi:hypothetical protein
MDVLLKIIRIKIHKYILFFCSKHTNNWERMNKKKWLAFCTKEQDFHLEEDYCLMDDESRTSGTMAGILLYRKMTIEGDIESSLPSPPLYSLKKIARWWTVEDSCWDLLV